MTEFLTERARDRRGIMTGTLDLENMPDEGLVACVVRPASAGLREAAFEIIYRRHARGVLALCGGLIWDDFDTARTIAQDALVVAYQYMTEGRPPDQPERLRAWLNGIARNRSGRNSAAGPGSGPSLATWPMTTGRPRADDARRRWTGS